MRNSDAAVSPSGVDTGDAGVFPPPVFTAGVHALCRRTEWVAGVSQTCMRGAMCRRDHMSATARAATSRWRGDRRWRGPGVLLRGAEGQGVGTPVGDGLAAVKTAVALGEVMEIGDCKRESRAWTLFPLML